MLAVFSLLVVACTDTPQETAQEKAQAAAANAPDACRYVISRPQAPKLVQVAVDGATTRRPLLRPACFSVFGGAIVWADSTGAHVDVDGLAADSVAGGRIGAGCTRGIVAGHRRALVNREDGPVLLDSNGLRLITLPPLGPGESIVGIGATGVIVSHACETRTLYFDGTPDDRIFSDTDPVGRRDGQRLVFDDGRVLDAGFEIEGVQSRGQQTLAVDHDGRVRAWIGQTLIVDQSHGLGVWIDDEGIISKTPAGLVKRTMREGAPLDVVLFAVDDDHDIVGRPHDLSARDELHFAYDGATQRFAVKERLRDVGCSVRDIVVAVDRDGARRVLADDDLARANLTVVDGEVWFSEFAMGYESLAADNGTNVP